MRREELWLIYIEKNPKFIQEEAHITFTSKGLRQFFERTFDHAFEEGKKQAQDEKSTGEKTFGKSKDEKSSDFGDIFGSLFRKK